MEREMEAMGTGAADDPLLRGGAPDRLTPILDRNIAMLHAKRRHEEETAGLQERIAERITAFSGNMAFVYLHLAVLIGWVAVNLHLVPFIPAFDESFIILATSASVEAIFLSTFVLISQNRAAAAADRRADLDLQINLLAEHEITRILTLVRVIADKLDIPEAKDPVLEELEDPVAPERVLDEIVARQDSES